MAIQVDKGKDQAILKLQDGWSRLVQHWKELEEHRHSLAGRLQSERETNQRRESEWIQVRCTKYCVWYKLTFLTFFTRHYFSASRIHI